MYSVLIVIRIFRHANETHFIAYVTLYGGNDTFKTTEYLFQVFVISCTTHIGHNLYKLHSMSYIPLRLSQSFVDLLKIKMTILSHWILIQEKESVVECLISFNHV